MSAVGCPVFLLCVLLALAVGLAIVLSLSHTHAPLHPPTHPHKPHTECTYAHFSENSQCPSCQAVLGETDFTELHVTDATSSTDTHKNFLQAFFAKTPASTALHYADLATSLMRSLESNRVTTRFLLKQVLSEANSFSKRQLQLGQEYERLQQEVTRLKQDNANLKVQYDRDMAALQSRLNTRERANAELQKKIQLLQQTGTRGQIGSSVGRRSSGSGATPTHTSTYTNKAPFHAHAPTNGQSSGGRHRGASGAFGGGQLSQSMRPSMTQPTAPQLAMTPFMRPQSHNSEMVSTSGRGFRGGPSIPSSSPSLHHHHHQRINKRKRVDSGVSGSGTPVGYFGRSPSSASVSGSVHRSSFDRGSGRPVVYGSHRR